MWIFGLNELKWQQLSINNQIKNKKSLFPHKFVKTDPSDSIQNYRIVVHPCTVLDVTNANLFEHYLNVLFMNLTINYIYSPSAV